jgi:hypothetical protein
MADNLDLFTPNTSDFEYSQSSVPSFDTPPNESTSASQSTPPTMSPFDQALTDSFNNTKIETPTFKLTSYDPKLKERYKGDPSLYNDYFDPHADNERVAYENWDKMDALGAGLGGFIDNFQHAYRESALTWPRMGRALLNMDFQYLMPSEKDLAKMAMEEEKMRLENPIFYAPGTEDDFLTKGFMAETFQNLGFTFGTMAELVTEWGITAAVSAGLAATGAGAPAAGAVLTAEAAATTAKLGRIASVWQKMGRFFVGTALDDAAKAGTKVTQNVADDIAVSGTKQTMSKTMAEDAVDVLKPGVAGGVDVWDNALKIASKAPIVGNFADAARVIKMGRNGALTTGELTKIGAGALRRGFAEWQMAAGEASIEAGGNYGQIVRNLTDEYAKKNNGDLPMGEDLKQIKDMAMASSTADFGTNVAILAVMNKMMFGNMVRKFFPDSKAVVALRGMLMKDMAEEAGVLAVKNAAGKTKLYQKGLLGTLGLTPAIAEHAGKKVAAWEFGKSALKGATRFQVLEGLQENLQEGTNEYLVDYYTDLYKGDVASWGNSFNEAVDSQISKRGAKTFLMGAMTGMFVNPVVNTAQYVAGATGINPQLQKHRDSVAASIEKMNLFFDSDHKNVLNETIKNIKLQNAYNDGMVEGLSLQDRLQYENNKDSALIQAVMHARRTGTVDQLTAFIKASGDNMTDEDFKSAFGYTPQELNKSSASEVMTGISNSVKRFSDIYDKNLTRFGLYLSMEDYMKDPAARQKFGIKRNALLDAIETVSFMEAKGEQSVMRQKGIFQKIAGFQSIGSSLSSSFNALVEPDELDEHILIAQNEVKVLQEGEQTDKAKGLIASKQEEIELLSFIKAFLYTPTNAADPSDPTKTKTVWEVNTRFKNDAGFKKLMGPLLARYLQLKNDQNGIKTVVSEQEVTEAMDDIVDYIMLGKDHAEYVQAVNLLNDPDNVTNQIIKFQDARAGAYARLIYDQYQKLGEISEVAREWVDAPEQKKILDEILAFSKRPSGTFETFSKLQQLQNTLVEKSNELKGAKQAADKKQKEEQDAETARKQKISDESKDYVDIIALYEDPATRDEALQYMAMRYDLDDLKNNFPFASTDPNERVVVRYYIGPNGEKIAFPSSQRIPETAEVYPYDPNHNKILDEDDQHSPVSVKIDNFHALFNYLLEVEYSNFVSKTGNEININAQQTADTVQKVDNEKDKLINHVGSRVVLDGVSGMLDIVDNEFVVIYDNGVMASIAPVGEDVGFSTFTDLSLSYTKQPDSNQGIISNSPAAKVDVQESGVMTLEMSTRTPDQVIINGVTWSIDRNQQGEIIGFNRTTTNKKGKRKVQKMYGNNPVVQDYIRRVNAFLMMTRSVPETVADAADEMEVLDNLIDEASREVLTMEQRRMRGDEVNAQYQLNKMMRDSKTPDIVFLIHQWNNSETRADMSNDDLMKLFMWASDLRNKIKGKFTIYMGNRVLEGTMAELVQEYINPISEIIDTDGTERTKPKRATKRSSKEENGAEQLDKAIKSRKGKPAPTENGAKPEGKKSKARSVKTAVESVEAKAEKTASKRGKKKLSAPPIETVQRVNLGPGTRRANRMTPRKLGMIQESIAVSRTTEIFEPTLTNPFESLKQACNV